MYSILALSRALCSAAEALQFGLVSCVVPADQLDAEVVFIMLTGLASLQTVFPMSKFFCCCLKWPQIPCSRKIADWHMRAHSNTSL